MTSNHSRRLLVYVQSLPAPTLVSGMIARNEKAVRHGFGHPSECRFSFKPSITVMMKLEQRSVLQFPRLDSLGGNTDSAVSYIS